MTYGHRMVCKLLILRPKKFHSDTLLEIPTFPTVSVSHTNHGTSHVGIFGPEIPTEFPTALEIPTRSRGGPVDLADFEEADR